MLTVVVGIAVAIYLAAAIARCSDRQTAVAAAAILAALAACVWMAL